MDKGFDKSLKKRADAFVKKLSSSTRARVQECYTINRYFRGDSLGWFGDDGKWWQPTPRAARMIRKQNIVAPKIRANTTNFVAAAIDIEVDPRTDYPKKQGSSNIAKAIVDYYDTRHWTAFAQQMMAKHGQLDKAYFLYTRPDSNAGELKLKTPKIAGESQIDVPGTYNCFCGASGTEDEATESGGCPHCGQPVTIQPGQSTAFPQIGYDEKKAGDICLTMPHPFEMLVDEEAVGGRIDKASEIEWRCRKERGELKRSFPKAELKKGDDGKHTEDYALERKSELELSSGNINGQARQEENDGDGDDEKLLYRRIWWSKEKAETLKAEDNWQHEASGFAIKAGQTVAQAMFRGKPVKEFKGLYFSFCGDELLDIDNEDFRDYWSAGVWETDPSGFWGKGSEDLADQQVAFNNWYSLFYEKLMRTASPWIVFDGMMFNGEDFNGSPGLVIPTNPGYARDKPISHYLHQEQPAPLGGDFLAFGQFVKTGADEQSSVHPAMVGQSDASNPTYKGKLLERNQATMQMQPAVSIKEEVKRTWAKQILKHAQFMWTPEHYKMIEGEFSQKEIEWFKQANVECDFVISAKEGSGVPQTHLDKVMGLTEFVNMKAQDTNGLIAPQTWKQAAGYYGVDIGDDPLEMAFRQAEIRMEKIEELCSEAAQLEGQVDPAMAEQMLPQIVETLLSQCPVKPDSDLHEAHIEFYKKRAAEVEDDEPNPLRDACIARRIQQHKEAISMTMMAENQLALQAQEPQLQAQQQMEAANQQPEDNSMEEAKMSQQSEQANQKHAMDAQKMDAEARDKEAQRAHESKEKGKDRQHQLEVARIGAKAKSQPAAR